MHLAVGWFLWQVGTHTATAAFARAIAQDPMRARDIHTAAEDLGSFGLNAYTRAMRRRFHMPGILTVAYVVVGLIVAQQHHYFNNLGTIKRVFSAILAVLLWWLVLLGINLHIK